MLKVWLPLTGTLENKGISNVVPTIASGNSWASTGKIGAGAITLTKQQTILPTSSCMTGVKQMSYCYWVKVNTAWSAQWLDGITWYSTDGSSAYVSRQEFYTNCTLIGTWYKGGSISGKTFTPGVWTHIAGVFDYIAGTFTFYINGTSVGTTTNVDKTHYCRGDFYIGDNGVNICENDVRIYDHCLSAAEVHEISQGLVLHYKLDSFQGGYGNPNLITGYDTSFLSYNDGAVTLFTNQMNGGAQEIVSNIPGASKCLHLHSSGSNNRQYRTIAATSGKSYTISVDYYSTSNQNTALHCELNGGNYSWTQANGLAYTTPGKWIRLSATYTNLTSNATLYYFIYCTNGTDCYVKNFKIEEGTSATNWVPNGITSTIIQDSSGYGHNGTITGTPTLNSNTPRYSSCINLTSGQKISVTGLLTSSDPIWTANFWVKMYSNTYTAWADVITFKGNKPIRVEVSNSNGKNLAWYNYPLGTSNGIPISNINYDEWNMITMVWNGTSILSYFNGVLKYTAAISGTAWTPNGEMTIGDTGMYMYMSDVRIYCTALSVDDILSLYHTAAKVDNLGNIHTFEFQEKNNPKIYKTGITEHKEMREAYIINTAYSYSYKPAANTNNSTTSGIMVDFSAFTNETSPLSMTVDYDASWTNFAAGTGGTFSVYIQGNNRRVSDNAWAWEGSNYLTNKGGFTTLITANANGSTHVHYDTTIPVSWLSTYNASHMGMRTNYSDGNGTITISNIKITLTQNSCKIKNNYLQANTLIEK